VEQLISKSGLDADIFDVKELAKKRCSGSQNGNRPYQAIVGRHGEEDDRRAGRGFAVSCAKLQEAGKPKTNNDLFAGCSL